MNNSTQAQKGFQTFVLTLSVSLILFSVIYYFVTNLGATPGISKDITEDTTVTQEAASSEEPSVFKRIADSGVDSGAVLAGADSPDGTGDGTGPVDTPDYGASAPLETTESTQVPDTGVVGITLGLLTSLALFGFVVWYMRQGPRRLALTKFENRLLQD
jgi:hypothetical protein